VSIVVTVDQWTDLVERLAGPCGDVTTIISGDAGDPHEFEPTPADNAAFTNADLVVMNGLDYDHWAERAVDTLRRAPAVVNGGEVVGLAEGDNPHLWYSPTYVAQMADAVTSELIALAPEATDLFRAQATQWDTDLAPFSALVDRLHTEAGGRAYTATESVFDDMAQAIGLVDQTPSGYRTAAANGSDPAPGDVARFQDLFTNGDIDVLVYNVQTEGAVPEQLRRAAEQAGVPVVEVTETVPAGASSFEQWQVGQLDALAAALGVAG
jgi:zinc/manganese transport system substrate-binding protein